MGSKKLLITAGAIVLVASAAVLAPGIVSGTPFAPLLPVSSSPAAHHDPDGPTGNGNAYGHHKDSPEFPGDNGQGHGNGNGNAYGHHKDSPDFPGNNGNGQGHPDDD